MIAFLTGTPQLYDNRLILMVGGVGYGVIASSKVLQHATQATELSLFIHTHVREDALTLYGFLSFQEQQLFELMLGVSGVGPTTALHLVDKNPQDLIAAVQEANVAFFSTVPRVGRKLAHKIIIELRDKLGELRELNLAPLTPQQQTVSDALTALGFDTESAQQTVLSLDLTDLSDQAAIKLAIQKLSSHTTR